MEQTVASSHFLEGGARQEAGGNRWRRIILVSGAGYNGEARLRQAFDGMRYGKAKREMLDGDASGAGWKERMTYCLPFETS